MEDRQPLDHGSVLPLTFCKTAQHWTIAIVPIREEDVAPARSFQYFLSNIHWLDALSPPLERRLQEIAAKIKPMMWDADWDVRSALSLEFLFENPNEGTVTAAEGEWEAESRIGRSPAKGIYRNVTRTRSR